LGGAGLKKGLRQETDTSPEEVVADACSELDLLRTQLEILCVTLSIYGQELNYIV
jgi:hypothetical protein